MTKRGDPGILLTCASHISRVDYTCPVWNNEGHKWEEAPARSRGKLHSVSFRISTDRSGTLP